MNNICTNNSTSVALPLMALANDFAIRPTVGLFADVATNHDLFILKQWQNVRTEWQECRRRFRLKS